MGKGIALTVLYSVALGTAIAGVSLVLMLILVPSLRSNNAAQPRVHQACSIGHRLVRPVAWRLSCFPHPTEQLVSNPLP
jgi:hypothetical protein